MLRRVMDAGAMGCEIIISGKLTGPRSRTEKFMQDTSSTLESLPMISWIRATP